MPIGAGLAVAGAGLAKAGLSFAMNRLRLKNRKKFEDTEFGKEQARIAKEGALSPKARGLITGSVARKAGEKAQTGKASFAGRLASQGLEGSIAGQRGLNEFDIAQQEAVSDTARDVALANEESKVDSRLSFAQQKLQDQREREAIKAQGTQQLIGDLGAIATQGITSYFAGKPASLSEIQKARLAGNITEEEYEDMILGIKVD